MNRRLTRSALVAAALSLLLAACAQQQAGTDPLQVDTVARDDTMALVRLRPGQDFDDLADVLLGDREAAWQIRELNASHDTSPGRIVAVPLRPLNPASVYHSGYRTLPILCYHQFTAGSRASHRLELTASAFENQLRYLRDHQYRILSLAEVRAIFVEGRPIPPRAVMLTIDDGYRSVYDVAWPLLRKYQAPATLFLYNDFMGGGKALTWQQVAEMQASGVVDVGSHGKSHASLSRLAEDTDTATYHARVAAELDDSAALIERHTGARPRFLSYPYGNSSMEAVTWTGERGYELAATVTRGINPSYANPLLLHRTMVYSDHDMEDFARFVRAFEQEPAP